MIVKNKNFILIILFIIVIQVLFFLNNTQKTSFRYFIWTLEDVRISKLINISFFSGLLVSTFLINSNNRSTNYEKLISDESEVESYPPISDENTKSNIDMPPQRDIRDAQPTISVNYRVIKNSKQNNQQYEQNSSNYNENEDDWINDQKDW